MKTHSHRHALVLAASVLTLSAFSSPALAALTQATCTTGSFDTAVPVAIGATRFVKQTKTPLAGANDMTLYNFNTNSGQFAISTNSNVTTLQPYLGFFATEATYDYLEVKDGTSPTTTHTYSGLLNLGTTPTATADTWLTGANPATGRAGYFYSKWVSDYSVANYAPPSFAQVTPKCSASQTATAAGSTLMIANYPSEGLLIKTDDAIYFRVTQLANTPMIISLDTLAATSGADWDIFVSSSVTTPDGSSYTWRGYTTDTNEAIEIPTAAAARTLYIGVHSYAGAGHFMLHADHTNPVSSNICVSNANITGSSTLTSTQLATLKTALRAGAAHLLGWTNGLLWRKSFNLISWPGDCTTASGCDVCIVNDATNTSFAYPIAGEPCGHIDFHAGNWGLGAAGGPVFAHESGHACLSLADEYTLPAAGDASPRWCGHTNMANNSKALAFCSINHCSDGSTTSASCGGASGAPDNWEMIRQSTDFNFYGPDYYTLGLTADATPMWNNNQLMNLVSFNF